VNRILVIRFSSIGDIVLTSPVVRCLKQQLPGAEIHFLTKKAFAPILQDNPHIDQLHLYDRNFSELIPQLKSTGFSFVADLHKNYRSAYVRRHIHAPSKGFPKLNIRKWLAVNMKWNTLPDIHIVDRYFHAVKPLGIINDKKGLEYFIPPQEEVQREKLPAEFQQGYFAIVTGAKHGTKRLPAEAIASVCHLIRYPVILLGGKEDKPTADAVAEKVATPLLNGCGRYSLHQSASLVRQSRAVLSNDTGLMHIAAAFNKPMVSVWGNTIPGFGMYPCLPAENPAPAMIAEVKGLTCRPCSKIGHKSCPKGHFRCMNEIDTERIAVFLNRFR
jgi:lipopolysaccharide heptosyltransferase II